MLSIGVFVGEVSPVEKEERVPGQLAQDQPAQLRWSPSFITLSCSPQPRLAGPEGGGHGVRPALALGLHTDPGPTLVTSDGAGSGRDLTSLYPISAITSVWWKAIHVNVTNKWKMKRIQFHHQHRPSSCCPGGREVIRVLSGLCPFCVLSKPDTRQGKDRTMEPSQDKKFMAERLCKHRKLGVDPHPHQ